MILWLALFFLVVAVSFVLAFLSMKDYQEIPVKSREEYALYLIRNPHNLNAVLLDTLRERILPHGLIVSIERLFKGKQAVLTIYGPRRMLEEFNNELNFLELEDYSLNLNSGHIAVWEVTLKNKDSISEKEGVFRNFPMLRDDEQFFWQIVLGAGKTSFQTQIRAAVYSIDHQRRSELAKLLQNFSNDLIKVPRPFSAGQMLTFYRLRSFGIDSEGPVLHPEKIISLLKI